MFRNKPSVLVMMLIIVSIIVSGCSSSETVQVPSVGALIPGVEEPEPESTPVITVTEVPLPQVVEETPSVTSTSASTPETDETETQQEAVVNVKEGVFTLAKVEIDGHYLPGLEILELGNVVEDCQRLYLTFYLTGEDPVSDSMWFQYKISASQWRALTSALISEGLIEKTGASYIEYIDLSHLGYEMEISVESEEFPLYKIISPSGEIIWDSNARIPPRQLNDVESAYYKKSFIDNPYSAARLLDLDNYDVYDPREKSREEVCSDYYRSNNNIDLSRFSVLEAEARRLVLTTYLENNPDVFLIVNYYRGDVFNDKVGELVVSSANGVLTPFASDRLSSFYRTNNSSVNIRFSEKDTMGLAFNPREFGIISIGSSVDFQEYINDISSWGFSPTFNVYGRSVSTFWISPKDLNIRNLVSASLLVLTDDDVVEILEGMTKN